MNHTVSAESCPLCLKIWNLTREQLSVKYPFFRKLIWDFSFQESSDTHTAGTDGHIIYFAPKFLIRTFQKRSGRTGNIASCIMLYHCLFLHLVMESAPDQPSVDRACDLSVERLITGSRDVYVPVSHLSNLMTADMPQKTLPSRLSMITSSGNLPTAKNFSNR